jgi:hypothetical protein
LISRSFCCLLYIPPPENDTVDEAGGSATDVNSESAVHAEQQLHSTQNSQSCSGSRTRGKSTGRGEIKDNILLTTTKNISNILSESLALQRTERQSD